METSTVNLDKLLTTINRIVNNCSENIIINAGHTLVLHDNEHDTSITNILEEQTNDSKIEEIQDIFGDFPTSTFEIGAMIAADGIENGKNMWLTVLVNDWQFIKTDPERLPHQANKYRQAFYESFKKAPPRIYQEILKKYKLNGKNIWVGCSEEDRYFYRETRLRDRFKREINKRLKQKTNDQILDSCTFDSNKQSRFIGENSGDIYYQDLSGEKWVQVVEGGKANCAGELTQMTKELINNHNAGIIINVLPIECQNPVNLGVAIAYGMYQIAQCKVINVFPIIDENQSFLNSNYRVYSFPDK